MDSYAEVIVPLKFSGGVVHYSIPEELSKEVGPGVWVVVTLARRRYLAVVRGTAAALPPELRAKKILPIEKVASLKPLHQLQLDLWQAIADYYLCSPGEVFKCAYPAAFLHESEKTRTVNRARRTIAPVPEKELSAEQARALEQIRGHFGRRRAVLLHGVTSSGKTEIYLKLAGECLSRGRNVLYLVPEIAMSRQLEQRIGGAVGEQLLVYHSRQTLPMRKKVYDRLCGGGSHLVLGTRSALFLPLDNLGLIIVDEEHDASYKQDDPAPRYNGRDVALMLAARCGADILLGSATPSMESLYNVAEGKFALTELKTKYYGAGDAPVKTIDMGKVYAMHNARGSFSMQLVNLIAARLKAHQQVMVFRSRRAYSSFLQCGCCGEILRCPNCNVSLSYHKFDNSVSCHYCGYRAPFSEACPFCGKGSFRAKGAGTERIAEELQELFPEARIERFDAETAARKSEEKRILGSFESGETDILVGTQMITKGFDFEKLSLVAVINADSLLSLQDFRADEKAFQLLSQLRGRVSRREGTGLMAVQTFKTDHPVLQALVCGDGGASFRQRMLSERRQFDFAPYVRIILLTVKDACPDSLKRGCNILLRQLRPLSGCTVSQALPPAVDRIGGKYLRNIWIKLPRTARSQAQKRLILAAAESAAAQVPGCSVTIDVDPL